MEYVGEKASLHELTKTVRAWERKVEIAEVCVCVCSMYRYLCCIYYSPKCCVCLHEHNVQ